MSSTSEGSDPTSPRLSALDFSDWSVRPMPLDAAKHGERAVFWDNFHGLPTIVGRGKYNEHQDGCIVYTKDPIPIDTPSAWRITVLETANYDTGLTIGLTPAPPDKVPHTLPLHEDFNYDIKYTSESVDARVHANTLSRSRRLYWDFPKNKSIYLILTAKGDLHIYFDERHIRKIASGLPVPLWGAVEVSGKCARIKSELLSKPPDGNAAAPEPQHHSIDVALPPLDCFKEKRAVKVEVPHSKNTVTVVPRGIGAVLKVPPVATKETDAPLTFAFTTCTLQSLACAAGHKYLGPISYIASNKPLGEEVEVLLEHRVNIESIEQAGDMVFCHANLPEDGSSEIHFSPLQGGEFEVGKPRGRIKTNELGFFVVATKAAKPPPIRYAVMCCYSNEDGDTKRVGLSISVANEVYMTNFRDALQEEWNTSVSEISKVPVVFQDSNARVSLPPNRKGWKILLADTQHCEFFKEEIDFEGRDSFSKIHYPPRFTFIMKASRRAKSCAKIFSVTGLDRGISFQIPLNPAKSNMSHKGADIEKPTLVSLDQLGDIRIIEESASKYYQIGIILLNDRHGDQLAQIEHDHRAQTAKMTEIYRMWLKQGASWATLCDCLQRCHLVDLADRIKNRFGIVSPSALPDSSFSDSESVPDERTPLIPSPSKCKCCQCCTVQ